MSAAFFCKHSHISRNLRVQYHPGGAMWGILTGIFILGAAVFLFPGR